MKALLISLSVVVLGTLGLVFYTLNDMSIEQLIMCSSNEGGIHLPGDLCEYYMFEHRMTEKDIATLQSGAGLDYILNSESPNKYHIATAFIEQGLDVNGINNYGSNDITPLHGAVLLNDVDRATFLLDQGADKTLQSEGYGMTALELAQHLQGKGDEDLTAMIALLSSKAQ